MTQHKTSMTELLEWHCTKDDPPIEDMKVVGQYFRPDIDTEPDFFMVYTDGERWFDSDNGPNYSVEEPDFWAVLGGVKEDRHSANIGVEINELQARALATINSFLSGKAK